MPEQGFKVALAKDGISGYHKAQILQPQLILLDANLPKPDSIGLIRMLSGLPQTTAIPVFLLAQQHSSEECIRALRAGAVDYVAIPYVVEELTERIRTHVRLAQARLEALALCSQNGTQPNGHDPSENRGSPAEFMLVRVAREVIDEQLTNPPTQKALAEMFGVSQRRLISAFQSCLGVSVGDYIRNERMKKAQEFLVNTTLNLADISDALGFSSPANFATAFKAHCGLTPREYRNRSRSCRSGGSGNCRS